MQSKILRNSTFFQCLLLSVGSPFSCSLQSTSTVKFRYMHRAANLDRLVRRTVRGGRIFLLKGKSEKTVVVSNLSTMPVRIQGV